MVWKSSIDFRACSGTLHLGSRPIGPSLWLAAGSFLGHQHANIKLLICYTS